MASLASDWRAQEDSGDEPQVGDRAFATGEPAKGAKPQVSQTREAVSFRIGPMTPDPGRRGFPHPAVEGIRHRQGRGYINGA